MRAVIAIVALVLWAVGARATENPYADPAQWKRPWEREIERRLERAESRREVRHRHAPRVKAWVKVQRGPDPAYDGNPHCLIEKRAVGTPHATEAAAIDAAKRDWQAVVRYDHGEKYMNIEDARNIRYRCARAETNETTAGRVVESVTGGNVWRMRCEIVAQPCRRGLEPVR